MWALIILLGMSGPYSSGATITTVHGFHNEESCIRAGEKITSYAHELQPGCVCIKVFDKPIAKE